MAERAGRVWLRRGNGCLGAPGRSLLELIVPTRAAGELRRQRCVLVQVETPKDTRLGFLVAVAALRTPHDTVSVGRAEIGRASCRERGEGRGAADRSQ